MLRLIAMLAVVCLQSGCSASRERVALPELPALSLTPASLGRPMALQQRLEISAAGQSQMLDALLEVDAQELRLGVQALGQSVLTLQWDGKTLQQQRAQWLPTSLSGERILFDLQLVFWPADPIRASLPKGWQLLDDAGHRRLLRDGAEVLNIEYVSEDHAVLTQVRDRYQLDIRSVVVAGATP